MTSFIVYFLWRGIQKYISRKLTFPRHGFRGLCSPHTPAYEIIDVPLFVYSIGEIFKK